MQPTMTDKTNEQLLAELAALRQQVIDLEVQNQQRNVELELITSIGQALTRQLDFQAIIDLVGDRIRQIFVADTTYIALYNPQTDLIHFPYYVEQDHHHAVPGWSLDQESLTSDIIIARRPLLYNSRQEQKGGKVVPVTSPDSAEDLNESYLGVPIFAGDAVTGVISVQSYRPYAYNNNDVRLLTTIAANMGVALENARLFDETRRLLAETEQRVAELTTVNHISQALAAELDLDSLIQLVGEQTRQTLSADIAYVALHDPQTNLIHFPYVYGEGLGSMPFGEGLTSKIIERAEPLLINEDVAGRTSEIGASQVGMVVQSYLGVPITVGRQAIGVISVQSLTQEGRFGDDDVRLLSTIAANVGAAIQNARLFAEIQHQKQYLEALVQNTSAAIVTVSLSGQVETWNPAAERLFGYTPAEAIGQNLDDLVAGSDDIHGEALRFSRDVAHGEPLRVITRRTRKDGTLVDVELFAEPVTVDGETSGIIAIYHDITELLRARHDAEAAHAEAELARAAAEKANRAKSAFLANMSHELRTPLNAIIGFTRIVRRKAQGTLPEKQIENLDKVLVSAEHLLGLINTILDIAKIEAGRTDVLPVTFDASRLVDLCITTTQPLLKPGVRLVKEVEPDLPPVYSDQGKIKQILLNLLSNAAKFAHEGKIVVTVRSGSSAEVPGGRGVEPAPSPSRGENLPAHPLTPATESRPPTQGQVLIISVTDTGIGISEEALPHVFEEFQQADNSTTREYGGTGLGLSISRSLARLLGGDLTAESTLDVGSTFTLTLPVHYGLSPTPQPSAATQPTTQPITRSPNQPVVLAIDDNPDVVYLLQENLGDAGYQVIGAGTAAAGLEQARELRPSAIILDIILPDMDGWQVLHELKIDPRTKQIPTIILTVVDKKALGYRLGAADYLVKPLDEQTVLAALQRLTQANGGRTLRRLLVVDDDPSVGDMVRQLLAETDYEMATANDGLSALESIAEQKPDVILLDLLMPRLDGFGLLQQLRQNPDTNHIPVIVLTAKTLTQAEASTLQASVSQVIQKQGLTGKELLRELQRALPPVNSEQ